MSNVETARLAHEAVLNSKIEFENVDVAKAMRYIYVVGGMELINVAGSSRLAPK